MSDKVVYMINITHDERSRSQKYEWSIKSWAKWCKKNNVELYNRNGIKYLYLNF